MFVGYDCALFVGVGHLVVGGGFCCFVCLFGCGLLVSGCSVNSVDFDVSLWYCILLFVLFGLCFLDMLLRIAGCVCVWCYCLLLWLAVLLLGLACCVIAGLRYVCLFAAVYELGLGCMGMVTFVWVV